MQRNRVILGSVLFALVAGLLLFFLMPTDAKRLQAFTKGLVMINLPVEAGTVAYRYTYTEASKTTQLQPLYFTAMNLNMAARKALTQVNTLLIVPQFKNKKVQAYVSYTRELFIIYLNTVIKVSQETINLAVKTGYISKLPPLIMPKTDQVSAGLTQAYTALYAKKA